ncbi:ankyrin repeat domain-containing protein 40-like [Chrysoperla carnea]|uniref:ankyrin repeat domain-containing protein 40-like n=1 Tax=Chrysoperla carnea TaxID=189513 RepID=UPI001D099BE4|nr:ankyrin repeat domain-containing protein 40-like [Chrysoperla carnea]
MNPHIIAKEKEEKLREAACLGDIEAIDILIQETNINARHEINGWTALHWAAKRGHAEIVRELLMKGADPRILNDKGETPLAVATDPEIRKLLGGQPIINVNENIFKPNYLKNPPLNGQVDIGPRRRLHASEIANMKSTTLPSHTEDLVLKIRVANSSDPDFIEIEILKSQLTYNSLLELCSAELGVKSSAVTRIRKLPDTRLRNDSDVKRLSNMQCLELVLFPSTPTTLPNNNISHNGYQSITSNKDQTILY